ncbi:recombinase family protein [Psychrosphaera aestuarii]|uniref:recombinase family protein n=1 Tax=Psychrosphaera aestuarii TaxID=1266052 RepID=UPI001B34041A|nr:recombinase family protein [Psychrosphaera aestuarii]
MTDKKLVEKPLVVSYLRWSSGNQKLGDSERRQLEQANEWIAKNGYELNENFVLRDDGKSGYHSENFGKDGALGKFVRQAEAGEVPRGTVLIIEDFSRFSRSHVRKALKHFLGLIDAGIRIYVAKDDMEFNENNSDEIKIIITLSKMAAAYEESHRKSNHLKKFWNGARQRAANNSHSKLFPVLLPSTSPDWLRKVTSKDGQKYFEPIPERVAVIKRIFELADTGGKDGLGLGSTIIARILDSEGIKPFKGERANSAISFNDSYILRLLRDRRLLGYLQPYINPVDEVSGKRKRQPDGEPIANYFPPLIGSDLFERVNFKMEQRKQYQGGKVSRKFTNLFTKIGKCAYCGSSMTLFTKRGSKAEGGRSAYLQCSEGTKLRKCGNKAVRYFDTFEKSVIKSLVELDLSSLFQSSEDKGNHRAANLRKNIFELKKQQKKIASKIKTATNLLLEDPNDKDIVEARNSLKKDRDVNESEIEKLNTELISLSRKSNYEEFKDSLKIVLNSFTEEDEISTYNKRRAINTYLIDVLQYIAIDGVKQQAWIVFDIEFAKNLIRQSFKRGQEEMERQVIPGIPALVSEYSVPSEKEIDAFAAWGSHIKLKLRRFVDRLPNLDDVIEMREFFEVAPSELLKINRICNEAINKNWRRNKRLRYTVLDNESFNEVRQQIIDEFYVPLPDDYEPDEEWLNASSPEYKNGDIIPRPQEIYAEMKKKLGIEKK